MYSIIDLDSTTLHNIFEAAQMLVSFCISLRAFYLYRRVRNPRLLILWLALNVITLTSAASLAGDNHLLFRTLNTNWFKYIGQTVCFLFIWLSTFQRSPEYLRHLKNWHIFSSFMLIALLTVTPLLPPFPNAWLQVVLSTMRAVACLLIFFQYVRLFFVKETRFSLLMGIAFLLLSFGYLIIFPKYILAHQDLLSNIGDTMRISGLVVFLIGYLVG